MEPLSAAVLTAVAVGEEFHSFQILGVVLALIEVILFFKKAKQS